MGYKSDQDPFFVLMLNRQSFLVSYFFPSYCIYTVLHDACLTTVLFIIGKKNSSQNIGLIWLKLKSISYFLQ